MATVTAAQIPQLPLSTAIVGSNGLVTAPWSFWFTNIANQVPVTGGPVLSINGRNGNVILVGSDITRALGFTPVNNSSPAFTGIPTSPTAIFGTNTNQIATTSFVQTALSAGLGGGYLQGYGTGSGSDTALFLYNGIINNSYTVENNDNVFTMGDITIEPGSTVTLLGDSNWTVVETELPNLVSIAKTTYALDSATTTVNTKLSPAPAVGNILRATSSTTATWQTFNPFTYPSAGITNSTGTAWGTPYSTTGSGTVLALATSPSFTTPILGTPTSGNFSTGTFTWPTFNQNTTGNAATATTATTSGTTSALLSATTTVNVSASAAPSIGQILTATSGTAATWQTPAINPSPVFKAYLPTTNQSISTNTDTQINLTATSFDSNSFFNTTSSVFQPTIAGYYQINWAVYLTNGTTNAMTYAESYIKKNTTINSAGNLLSTNSTTSDVLVFTSVGSDIVYLNGTTDYVSLWVFATGTSLTANYGSQNTFMSGALV